MSKMRNEKGQFIKGYKKEPFTEEHKRNISKAGLGRTPWNKGLVGVMPVPWNKGIKMTKEHRLKLSLSHLGTPSPRKGRKFPEYSGENNPNWKGGTTKAGVIIRTSLEYKEWRDSVFNRDSYTCKICGQVGGDLEADHIKLFSIYPELRFDIDNGQTLCKECHRLKTREDLKSNWSNQYSEKETLYAR